MENFQKVKKICEDNFPIGTKIKIISMKNVSNYDGREGVVEYIDGIGQLHGTWGGLALIPDVDKFIKIN